jgi:hypothetical protein
MKAIYIKRHDNAVRIIQQAIAKGDKGGCYMVMDAGKLADLPEGVHGKRIPEWMLPDIDAEQRERLRPVIMFVPGMTHRGMHGRSTSAISAMKRRHPITIFEVGYTSDTRYTEKLAEKRAQHAVLVHALQAAGWQVRDNEAQVIALGAGGTIYSSTKKILMDAGVPRASIKRALTKLHRNSVIMGHAAVVNRRQLETASTGAAGGRQVP